MAMKYKFETTYPFSNRKIIIEYEEKLDNKQRICYDYNIYDYYTNKVIFPNEHDTVDIMELIDFHKFNFT